ncbi:MAG: methyltransferase domain-containing protein, partial [Desulfobulbaceae bacterium]|nr:methyltransferase domain-containing protein [Desulfobulbaceae bacterium]
MKKEVDSCGIHPGEAGLHLKEEAEAFDSQILARIQAGFVPDLRRLKKLEWFYNNIWRDPEFVKINLLPKVNFVINIAKKTKGDVLEIGCGSGYLSLELARHGLNVLGIDLSEENIAVARKTADEIATGPFAGTLRYKCDDIMKMALAPGLFDSVIFFSSLHHMPTPLTVLEKVHKILKPSGNLIVVEPIRGEFTKKSAEIAALLRLVLPTYISFEEKLASLKKQTMDAYIREIHDEYTFRNDHQQSPHDNLTNTAKTILDATATFFEIIRVQYSGAFL